MARLLLVIAVVIWGFTFVATKVCLEHLRPFELLGLRLAIAVPLLWGVARWRGVPLGVRGHTRPILLGSAILLTHFLVQITGLEYTSASKTGWIIAVTPLVLAVLAAMILGERLGGRAWAGVGCATIGILVLVSGGRLGDLSWLTSVGDWLVLLSAHTWALYTIVIRDATRALPPLAVTLAVMTPGALVVLVAMAVASDWGRIVALPAEAVAWIAFLGVCGSALAHWFWQVGVSRVGAARAGLFLYLEPLATTALAAPYLGESIGPATVAGGGLVLLGVALAQRR